MAKADPQIRALQSSPASTLVVEAIPLADSTDTLLCDTSTGTRTVFDSLHSLSHPGIIPPSVKRDGGKVSSATKSCSEGSAQSIRMDGCSTTSAPWHSVSRSLLHSSRDGVWHNPSQEFFTLPTSPSLTDPTDYISQLKAGLPTTTLSNRGLVRCTQHWPLLLTYSSAMTLYISHYNLGMMVPTPWLSALTNASLWT